MYSCSGFQNQGGGCAGTCAGDEGGWRSRGRGLERVKSGELGDRTGSAAQPGGEKMKARDGRIGFLVK